MANKNIFSNLFGFRSKNPDIENENSRGQYTSIPYNLSYNNSLSTMYINNIIDFIANRSYSFEATHMVNDKSKENNIETFSYENDHITKLLSGKVNPVTTTQQFFSQTIREMIIKGYSIAAPFFDKKGNIISIETLGGKIDFESRSYDNNGRAYVLYYPNALGDVYQNNFTGINKVVYLDSILLFISPMKIKMATVYEQGQLLDKAYTVYKNGVGNSSLKLVLQKNTAQNSVDQSQIKIEKQRNEDLLKSSEGSGIATLYNGEKLTELSNNINTPSLDEINNIKTQLSNLFGLNPNMLSNQYSEEESNSFNSNIIEPFRKIIEIELNEKLLTDTQLENGENIEISYDLLSASSLKDKTDFMTKGLYSGVINDNEARKVILGYKAYNGGDTYRTNKNSVDIGPDGRALNNEENTDNNSSNNDNSDPDDPVIFGSKD